MGWKKLLWTSVQRGREDFGKFFKGEIFFLDMSTTLVNVWNWIVILRFCEQLVTPFEK